MFKLTVISNTDHHDTMVESGDFDFDVTVDTVSFSEENMKSPEVFVRETISETEEEVIDVNPPGKETVTDVETLFVIDAESLPEYEGVLRELVRQLPRRYILVISKPTKVNIDAVTQLQHVLHVNANLQDADIQNAVKAKIEAIHNRDKSEKTYQTTSEKAFTVMQNIIEYRSNNQSAELSDHSEEYISILNSVVASEEIVLTLNEGGNENTNSVVAATSDFIDQSSSVIHIPDEIINTHSNAVMNVGDITDEALFTETQTIQTSRVNETESVEEFDNHFATPITGGASNNRLGYLHLLGESTVTNYVKEIVDVIVIVSDMLGQVVHSKRQTEQLNREVGKLEQFIYIISHDLINPLSTAKGYVDAAQKQTSENESATEFLDTAAYALDRVEKMVRSTEGLLAAGKTITDDEKEVVSISSVANDSWKIIDPRDAELIIEDDCEVYGNRQQLNTIFENLFKNAIQHGDRSVTLRVGKKQHISTATRKDPDDKYTIYIEDDGTGIDDEIQDSLFEMNVTTKKNDSGNGIGMNIIKTAVEAHGWEIELDDRYNNGARFEIKNVNPSAQ
mgnify:CR=1 FL=1